MASDDDNKSKFVDKGLDKKTLGLPSPFAGSEAEAEALAMLEEEVREDDDKKKKLVDKVDGKRPLAPDTPMDADKDAKELEFQLLAEKEKNKKLHKSEGMKAKMKKGTGGVKKKLKVKKVMKPKRLGALKKTKSYSWKSSVLKSLKQVHPELGIGKRAMEIMDDLLLDTLQNWAAESVHLMRVNGKRTLDHHEMEAAVRLHLPGELAKHAISEAERALQKYQNYGQTMKKKMDKAKDKEGKKMKSKSGKEMAGDSDAARAQE